MHTKFVCLLNISLVVASRFLSSHENQQSLSTRQISAPLSPEAELEQLQASIASLQAKLWVATNKTAAFKAREAQYIKDLRAKWKARATKIGGYQQRQVELDAGFDALRTQYAETNAECQQHLAVHQKLKQQISRLALSQQIPADYAVGAAVLPAGVRPGSPVIVPTTSGPMLVVPGPEARVGAVFQFLFPLHSSKATNAAYVGSTATTPQANIPIQQKPADTQVKVQQPQQSRKQHDLSSSIKPEETTSSGAIVQAVPGLPVAAVSDPGDFPQGWPKAQWRLNFTYADLLRSPWQKWLAHEVVADDAPTPAPKKPKMTDGPSRYELMKLETQLKWQLKIEENSVTMYENLMMKYEAMMLRANVNSQSMKEHIQASEANYGETGNYLKAEINALEAMCNAAQDLSSPGAQAAVTKMTSAPQSFGIFSRQAQFEQKTALGQAFVLGAKHCADEYDWRRTDVQHWEECAFLCRAESACEGFRFALVATEENCQLTDSCDLGSTRATAFEEPHWQTFFRRDTGDWKASKYNGKEMTGPTRVFF
eukprot:gnl/MRDRNA2_/MRDRNA2_95792_c0_seq1.p1 gnl/MRDRNA2_/MRDRNA2_95792_c0~~gnl/MRDRNA2_/MRDRNA2_95792_c0_seq1.p1  ORF type:complete len:540 (-),score=132.48 gnl/MRDRNA2_/MRDRNA2_95792_c0_seq1:84-1703(-)